MTAVDDFFLDVELVASYSKDCREGSVGRVEFVQKCLWYNTCRQAVPGEHQ